LKSRGMYFIRDGVYLHWSYLICPLKHEGCTTRKGYFSAKVETVTKDVECLFGILKNVGNSRVWNKLAWNEGSWKGVCCMYNSAQHAAWGFWDSRQWGACGSWCTCWCRCHLVAGCDGSTKFFQVVRGESHSSRVDEKAKLSFCPYGLCFLNGEEVKDWCVGRF
jgi:hypothetical protein